MKRIFFILLFFVGILSIINPLSSEAATEQQVIGDSILAQGQKHFGNFFAVGNSLRLEGDVYGDLYVVANELVINGVVHGDVLGLARKLTIQGTVDGDVRIVTQSLEVYGNVDRNISLVADQATIRDTAMVNGTITGVATNLIVLGPIISSIEGRYTNILLASTVGQDVNVMISNDFDSGLHVLATARVTGNLQYTALQPAQIANGAVISGIQDFNLLSGGNERLWFINLGDSNWWFARLAYFTSLLLVTLLLWRLSDKRWREVSEIMTFQPRRSLWYGLLFFVFVPVGVLLLIVSLVGLPIGLVLAVLYAMAWYFYPAWACVYLTTLIGQRITSIKVLPIPWQVMLGLMIIIALGQLPFAGFFFSVLLFILTTGALLESWLRWLKAKK